MIDNRYELKKFIIINNFFESKLEKKNLFFKNLITF